MKTVRQGRESWGLEVGEDVSAALSGEDEGVLVMLAGVGVRVVS